MSDDESLESILAKYPVFEEASHGKMLCTLTKHEMPKSVIPKYVKTKKFCYNYDAFVIERDYGQYFQLLKPGTLACLLTKRTVSKSGRALKNHIEGQRFQKALKQAKEAELKAAEEAKLKEAEEAKLKEAEEAELKVAEEAKLKAAEETELKAEAKINSNLNTEVISETMECENNNKIISNGSTEKQKINTEKTKIGMKRRLSNTNSFEKKNKFKKLLN